jgi:hypothetical protein
MQSVRQEFIEKINELRKWTNDLSASVLSSGGIGIERERFARAAITVLLLGSFEHHLKELVRRFIISVNNLSIPFDRLPDAIRHCHLERGAEFLRTTAKDERKRSRQSTDSPYIESYRVLTQLASVSRGVPYELVWEAFAQTDSNPGVEAVGNILRTLNIQKPWPTIAKNAPDPYRMPNEEVCQGRLEGLLRINLENLREARNRCAHGAISTAPQLSDLLDYLKALDALSEGCLITLNAELIRLQQGTV